MSTHTRVTAAELERRRRLAVDRVHSGYSQQATAEFLGVSKSAVSQWMKAHRRRGEAGLAAKPRPGRPRKLTKRQERTVLGWLGKSATQFGFPNELWTAPRVAKLIRRTWGVKFHPRYVCHWLARRRITPQKPQRVPRERDDDAIAKWLRYDWPRLQNARRASAPHWS
jgi:transposase